MTTLNNNNQQGETFHVKHGQSRRYSLFESVANIAIGYFVAVAAQVAIFPIFGIHVPLHSNLAIGGLFTLVSLARSYALRRLFNWIGR
jgi:hypothetical protein